MIRSVFIYGGLLLAALAVAWFRFTAEPEPDLVGEVALLQGDAEDIEKIIWNTEDDEVTIEARSDDRGEYLWVSVTHYEEKPVEIEPPAALEDPDAADPDAADPDAADPEPEMERVAEDSAFMAGEKGEELLTALSPMMALRRLEDITDEKLESLGLKDPQGEMQVIRKGRTATLKLGGMAFGTRDMYMQDTRDGAIYLIDDETVRPLKYARTRLPNRVLTSYRPEEIVSASLAKDGMAALAMMHKNHTDPDSQKWVRTENASDDDMQVNTWMGKAISLRASSYASPDDTPTGLVSQFTLSLTHESGASETIEVLMSDDDEWWGRSEHTRGLVKLLKSSTSALAGDVPDILSGSGASEEAPD